MRRTILCLAALCALATPAGAAPRVTLTQENATLHQILRKLTEQTDLEFRAQDGSGEPGHKDAPDAQKVRVEWRDAPLAPVIRQICGDFGLAASPLGDGGYWFWPGKLPERRGTSSSGVGVSVAYVKQTEQTTVVPGRADPQVSRSMSVQLAFRSENGDGQILGPLTRLSLTDGQGRTQEPALSGVAEQQRGLPDERVRTVNVPWSGPQAGKLQRVDGELLLYDHSEDLKFSVPVSGQPGARDLTQGPLHLHVTNVTVDGHRLNVELRLEWPSEVELPANVPGSIGFRTRLADGRADHPVLSRTDLPASGQGPRSSILGYHGTFNGEVKAIELIVPVRFGPARRVAFHLENVPLPFGQEPKLRTAPLNVKAPAPGESVEGLLPAELQDPQGGSLRLPAAPVPLADLAEVAIGLSRQGADGKWSVMRWVQAPVEAEVTVLRKLAPGTYRVRVRYWKNAGDGPPELVPGAERGGEVKIRRGEETRLP